MKKVLFSAALLLMAATAAAQIEIPVGWHIDDCKKTNGDLYGWAIVYNDDAICGVLGDSNVWIIPPRFDFIKRKVVAGKSYYIVNKVPVYGLYDGNGKELLPPVFDIIAIEKRCNNPKDVYFNIKRNGLWGVANSKGEIVVPMDYELPLLCKNGKYIAIDERDRIIEFPAK